MGKPQDHPVRAMLLPEDDGGDPVIIKLPAGNGQLAELQRLVGGYVEVIPLAIGALWINEEPWTASNKMNSLATTFVQAMSPGTRMTDDRITCPAVLTGLADEEGEITDLKGFHHTEELQRNARD